jgi:3-deoxy-D-arabino-heptulosonate 7-phosphate (DAHP) synthase
MLVIIKNDATDEQIQMEVHFDPVHAVSDGRQSLYLEQFQRLMIEIEKLNI